MRNPNWTRDELIIVLQFYFDPNKGSFEENNPKIKELSEILRVLPLHQQFNRTSTFRNPAGVVMKLNNIRSIDPDFKGQGLKRGAKVDKLTFEEFVKNKDDLRTISKNILEIIKNDKLRIKLTPYISNDETILEGMEGRILQGYHKYRERDPKLIKSKKDSVFKENKKLCCEVCSFDFYEFYGEVGKHYIECHHREPLYNFEINKKTKLEDLALVCSNCHRMLHRKLNILTVEDLREQLQNRR